MRRASAIEKDAGEITTVQDLTSVFESLASTQVAKVKNKVELSKAFFQLIWQRYSSIRVDPRTRITNRDTDDGEFHDFLARIDLVFATSSCQIHDAPDDEHDNRENTDKRKQEVEHVHRNLR